MYTHIKISNFLMKTLLALMPLVISNISVSQADTFDTSVQGRASISAFVGNSMLMKLSNPVNRVAVGDPNVADFKIVSPLELIILGKSVGTTNIILWHKNGNSTVIDTSISIDLSSLKKALEIEFPKETDIRLHSTPGSIVLSGSVSDVRIASAVVNLSEAHARNFAAATKTSGIDQVINLLKIRDLERQESENNQKLIIDEIRGIADTQQSVRHLQQGVNLK